MDPKLDPRWDSRLADLHAVDFPAPQVAHVQKHFTMRMFYKTDAQKQFKMRAFCKTDAQKHCEMHVFYKTDAQERFKMHGLYKTDAQKRFKIAYSIRQMRRSA